MRSVFIMSIHYYGQSHAQEVLGMLLDIHMNPDLYTSQSIHLPRGILLTGSPGIGKTLFAHKAAEVLNKELIIIKPSSDQLTVEIEDKFSYARYQPNCIVLLDELFSMIDKDPRTEGQLLAELDSQNDFLVIATTSASTYELDRHQALTRPGRFDIKIALSLPSYDDRLQYLDDNIEIDTIENKILSYITEGESYAFLTTFVNQLKIAAINNPQLSYFDVYQIKENLSNYHLAQKQLTNEELRNTAIHEVGHALYGVLHGRKLALVELSKKGQRSKTVFLPHCDDSMDAYLLDIDIALAGYAAGIVMNKKHMNGATLDFENVRNLFADLYRQSYYLKTTSAVNYEASLQDQLTKNYQKRFNKLIHSRLRKVIKVLHHNRLILNYLVEVLLSKQVLIESDVVLVIQKFNHK